MKKFKVSDYIIEPKEKIAKRIVYRDDNVIAFLLNLAKGEGVPPHTHSDTTVLIKVLSGTAELTADDNTMAIEENDLIKLDGSEKMSIKNRSEEKITLYVTISPLPPSEKYAANIDL